MSCTERRRRKVKCDKKHPCSNCARAKIECIFPGPGRAPRKSRKPPDAELLERLRRLEGVVHTLNAQVEEHEQEAAERERGSGSRQASVSEQCFNNSNVANSPSVVADNSVEGLETRFGRLVVDNGRSRYISNTFWASLNNEVEDLKSVLIEPSDDEEDPNSDLLPMHHLTATNILGGTIAELDVLGQTLATQIASAIKQRDDRETRMVVVGMGLDKSMVGREAFSELIGLVLGVI